MEAQSKLKVTRREESWVFDCDNMREDGSRESQCLKAGAEGEAEVGVVVLGGRGILGGTDFLPDILAPIKRTTSLLCCSHIRSRGFQWLLPPKTAASLL